MAKKSHLNFFSCALKFNFYSFFFFLIHSAHSVAHSYQTIRPFPIHLSQSARFVLFIFIFLGLGCSIFFTIFTSSRGKKGLQDAPVRGVISTSRIRILGSTLKVSVASVFTVLTNLDTGWTGRCQGCRASIPQGHVLNNSEW